MGIKNSIIFGYNLKLKTMEFKKCKSCNLEFPKTKDYFFITSKKQQNKSGLAIYKVYKSVCKKCHGKQGNEIRIKNRCLEMNCNVSEYRDNWKKQYSKTRTKIFTEKNQTVMKYHVENLTDTYIANRLKLSIKELPKEIIETKRLLLTIKREIKNGK